MYPGQDRFFNSKKNVLRYIMGRGYRVEFLAKWTSKMMCSIKLLSELSPPPAPLTPLSLCHRRNGFISRMD